MAWQHRQEPGQRRHTSRRQTPQPAQSTTVYPKRPGIPGFPGKQSPSISGDRLRGLSTIKNRTIKGLGQSSNLKVNRTIPLQRIQPLGGLGL
jgi:hypothetical protein